MPSIVNLLCFFCSLVVITNQRLFSTFPSFSFPSLLPLIKRSLVRASLFLIDQLVGNVLDQSEASIQVTWSALANQRPLSSIIGKLVEVSQSRLRLREQNEVIKISNQNYFLLLLGKLWSLYKKKKTLIQILLTV